MKKIDLSDLIGEGAYLSYDPEAEMVYLRLRNKPVGYTRVGAVDVNLDYTRANSLVGVEVFL